MSRLLLFLAACTVCQEQILGLSADRDSTWVAAQVRTLPHTVWRANGILKRGAALSGDLNTSSTVPQAAVCLQAQGKAYQATFSFGNSPQGTIFPVEKCSDNTRRLHQQGDHVWRPHILQLVLILQVTAATLEQPCRDKKQPAIGFYARRGGMDLAICNC